MYDCKYCSSSITNDIKKATFIKILTIKKLLVNEKYDRINLSGGEPLAHPNFFNIFMLCKEHADDVRVYSNLITHRLYNANVIDGVYLEANLTIPSETDKIHILRRVKQGRELYRPEVKLSRNFKMNCNCDHNVIKPDGTITLTPCNKSNNKINKEGFVNRIYVSGSHGTGKTTLIKDASLNLKMEYYENTSPNPYKIDIKKRQLWRLLKYNTDEELLNTINDRILINRCCVDWLIYTETFRELGWISEADYDFLITKYDELFSRNVPVNIVFLNPDIDWSKKRIIERWNEQIKWKEDDFHYYDVLREKYEEVMDEIKKISKVIEITDIDRILRVEKIKVII